MILTVTLNPAIDKTYRVDELVLGHVNRMESIENIPGGKGINVGKILCECNCPVIATGFLGGYTGRWIEQRLKEMGLPCDFVSIGADTRCSMNVVADNGYVTEILEPGPEIRPEERLVFLGKYRELIRRCDLVVLSGSVAPGLSQEIYGQLIGIAKDAGKKAILDTSGEGLVKGIEVGPWLVKPNRKELEYVVGHKCRSQDELLDAARQMLRNQIEWAAVSVGEKGMYLVGKDSALFAAAPKVDAVNTVGCGDSACAAFAISALREEDMEQMLRRAVAMSAANASTLESGSVPLKLAEDLMHQIEIVRI